jgi:hypothetical protein
LDANLNIGNDTTNYLINLNDAVISSENGILVLNNSNITLNGNITFDGDVKLSLGKKFFGINSNMEVHELIGLNEYFNNRDV